MENKHIDTIEYLLKLKAEKKKKEPSKIERDQFGGAWVIQALAEGYSERMERYLYSGLSYCGAKPFKEYIDQVENKEQALMSLFSGKMYGTNAESTFRLLTHLLALLLNDKKATPLACIVITRFPRACYNKDKKPLGNIDNILLKYFFDALDPTISLIPLAEMGIRKPVFVDEFISEMRKYLKNIDTDGLSKKKTANVEKVRLWLDEYQNPNTADIISETNVSKQGQHSPVSIAPKTNITTGVTQVKTSNVSSETRESVAPETTNFDNAPEESIPDDLTLYLAELLKKAGKAAVAIRTENLQQKNKNDILTLSLEDAQERLRRANEQNAEQQEVIADLRKKLTSAEGTILLLNQTVAQKDAIIADKTAEIEERIKMADVLSRDRSRQADETLQRLASKIRVEYRDFTDAMDIPMSCDLGENLKLQLQSVFDILEKGGMKIK